MQDYKEVIDVLRSVCPNATLSQLSGYDWIKAFADSVKNELHKIESEKVSAEKSLTENLAEKENEKKKVESELLKKLQEKENEKMRVENDLQKALLDKENERNTLQIDLVSRVMQAESVKKQLETELSKVQIDNSRVAKLVTQNEQLQASVEKYKRIIHDTVTFFVAVSNFIA